MTLSNNEIRAQIREALKESARNVEKAATFEDKRMRLWDQTNSVLLAIAFDLSVIAGELERQNL